MGKKKKHKLAILTSHVIQYQTPLFQKFAAFPDVDLTVYFCWDFGARKTYDPEFGKEIEWDIPFLSGFKYKFLKNLSSKPSPTFLGQINLGIILELWANRYDALMVFGWNSFTNWIAFFTAFLRGTPVLLLGENPLNQELLKPAWKRTVKKILFGKILFLLISALLYIGEQNKRFYKYYGVSGEKLFFVPYAVDNDRFITASKSLRAKRKSLRQEAGIPENATVILFVGKLIEKKRPMDLLRAYEMLANSKLQIANSKKRTVGNEKRFAASNSPLALVFVGDGALRPALERHVQEYDIPNVHFVGFKNQTELPKYYVISDVFVLPSGEGETWGLVVNEAMCSGLPVVVSDVAGCSSDLVLEGKNGYVIKCGDVETLHQRLLSLITNSKQRSQFGARSVAVIKRYSYEEDMVGITKALDQLAW